MKNYFDAIIDHFGLSGIEVGEISVRCPFHDDREASGSLNISKGKYFCHACGASHSNLIDLHSALEEQLQGEEEKQQEKEPTPLLNSEAANTLEDLAMAYLTSRGFPDPEFSSGVAFEVDDDPSSVTGGYLLMRSSTYGDRFVARNLLDNDNPKYYNSHGKKGLFFLGSYDPDASYVWLVEGVFDALSLAALGIEQVAATLGKASREHLYGIRHQTAFILFDDDYAGYSAARKTAAWLDEMGGNPVIVNLNRKIGSDPNEALVRNREVFRSWLSSQVSEYTQNDSAYISQKYMENANPMHVIPTGLPVLDAYLGGGLKDGVVAVGAEPGVGKTSFAIWLTARAVKEYNKRVLYVTYEISKRQVWSRIASIAAGTTWDVLETDPSRMSESERTWIERLSSRIRVAVGWSVNKIKYVIDDYDMIVVDYLQRMPGKPGEDGDEKVNASYNVRALGNLARDRNKVVLAVSSLNRMGYGHGQFGLKTFKESGDIEYAVQVAIGLLRFRGGEDPALQGILECKIVKNTRGLEGTVFLKPDLGHQTFQEAEVRSEF